MIERSIKNLWAAITTGRASTRKSRMTAARAANTNQDAFRLNATLNSLVHAEAGLENGEQWVRLSGEQRVRLSNDHLAHGGLENYDHNDFLRAQERAEVVNLAYEKLENNLAYKKLENNLAYERLEDENPAHEGPDSKTFENANNRVLRRNDIEQMVGFNDNDNNLGHSGLENKNLAYEKLEDKNLAYERLESNIKTFENANNRVLRQNWIENGAKEQISISHHQNDFLRACPMAEVKNLAHEKLEKSGELSVQKDVDNLTHGGLENNNKTFEDANAVLGHIGHVNENNINIDQFDFLRALVGAKVGDLGHSSLEIKNLGHNGLENNNLAYERLEDNNLAYERLESNIKAFEDANRVLRQNSIGIENCGEKQLCISHIHDFLRTLVRAEVINLDHKRLEKNGEQCIRLSNQHNDFVRALSWDEVNELAHGGLENIKLAF